MQIKLVEAHVIRLKNNILEFLLLKRSPSESYPNLWQMVTGSIQEGETAYQTAIREIREETSLIPEKLWIIPNINAYYSPKDDPIYHIPVFAALVNENHEVNISSEHSEFIWAPYEKSHKLLAWEGQRKSQYIIKEYFAGNSSYCFIEIKKSDWKL